VTLTDALRRDPLRTGATASALCTLAVTLLFWAGALPVTRSLSTFASLVSLTLVLGAVAAATWLPALVARLRRSFGAGDDPPTDRPRR
jgi:hypothetical protein